MAKLVCAQCGETNEFDAEFCAYCQAFLAWDEAAEPVPVGASASGSTGGAAAESMVETQVMPRFRVVPDAVPETSAPSAEQPDPGDALVLVRSEQTAVEVPATGTPVALKVTVSNTSIIVDGYRVEAVEPPPWLVVESDQVELLPQNDGVLEVRLRASSPTLVPAQTLRVTLRAVSLAQAPAYADLPVEVTVPVIEAPVRLLPEPRLLRLRDRDTAELTVRADNSGSNRAVTLRFAASDPEGVVRCRFEPAQLEVPPGGTAAVRVVAVAAPPDAGTEITRALTITALDGSRTAETLVTITQSTSAHVVDPPVTLEVEPALVRALDSTVAVIRVVADNRSGKQWAHLRLQATDPERAVRVAWAAPELAVPPGSTAYVDARLQAALPAPGTEVSRTLTITARNGERTSSTTATFVQSASTSPMATLVLRTDPSVVRVQDSDVATSEVVVDNRRGRSGVRVQLSGADPERALAFAFAYPTVDVGPGQAVRVGFRMDARGPQPGQEAQHPFTISAGDGQSTVETTGTLVQTTSRSAIETLAVRLDPSVLRLPGRRRGQLSAVVDNRQGAQPVRVGLRGDDPENSLEFRFEPAVLDVGPGQVGRTMITVKAPSAPAGRELTRPFMIMASDGRSEVGADGTLVQSGTERRPVARVLLTLLGGLAMIVGGFLPFWAGSVSVSDGEARAADLTAELVASFFADASIGSTGNGTLDSLIGTASRLVSVALVMIMLGVVAIFGLTGRSGRLTRFAAFLGAAFVVLVFVAFVVGGKNGGVDEGPGPGAIVLLLGSIVAYVGGLLRPRS